MSLEPSSGEHTRGNIRMRPNALQEDPDVKEDISYYTTPASMVQEEQWSTCAAMFSKHYGVWSAEAQTGIGSWAMPGAYKVFPNDIGSRLTEGFRSYNRDESQ